MSKPLRACAQPGCPELVERGYCEKHAKAKPVVKREDSRPTAAQRGYGSRWQKARAGYLRKHPLCVQCMEREGRPVPATVVDHIVPHKGDMKKFWDRSNWQALCATCHNKKTARGQ